MKIEEKIKKLLRLASSPNEHEASRALQMAQQLIHQYQVDPSSLEDVETSEEDLRVDVTVLETLSKKVYWKGSIAMALAQANGVQVWWHGGTLKVAGRQNLRLMVASLYAYLLEVMERLTSEALAVEKKRIEQYNKWIKSLDPAQQRIQGGEKTLRSRQWCHSYRSGIVTRLTDRIEQQAQEERSRGILDTEGRVIVSGLAVVDSLAKLEVEIQLWNKENGISLRSQTSKHSINTDAFQAGSRAGDSVSLAKQMTSGAKQLGAAK